MNILLAHFRVGETDGVSLEMDKWKYALEQLGHQVFYLAGSSGLDSRETTDSQSATSVVTIPELHYLDPFNDLIIRNAYETMSDFEDEQALAQAIYERAGVICDKVSEVIEQYKIDILVPNNVWSLGYHLSAAKGVYDAVEKTGIRVVCHHHDFHWEREKYSRPTCGLVTDLLSRYFPPKSEKIEHCVINHIAKDGLKARYDIDSSPIPNVFDFAQESWQQDEYNSDFRSRFGIKPSDVVLLQATRIVARKGIELAIDLVAELGQNRHRLEGQTLYNGETFTSGSRLILLFAGLCEEPSYLKKLEDKAAESGVELLFVNEWVGHSRGMKDGQKVYSLWDVYTQADMVTYPSLLEGWGNQFLEGLFARLPMVVYRYPVYATDIAESRFHIVDLGDRHQIEESGLVSVEHSVIENAAAEVISLITDKELRDQATEENFAKGLKSFSYKELQNLLQPLFS